MVVSYEQAVSEATLAFLKVMDIRGYARKDDLSEFQEQMLKNTEYSFYSMAAGPSDQADAQVHSILHT